MLLTLLCILFLTGTAHATAFELGFLIVISLFVWTEQPASQLFQCTLLPVSDIGGEPLMKSVVVWRF